MRNLVFLLLMTVVSACVFQPHEGYRLAKTVPVKSEGKWDLVAVDEHIRHVYIAHSSKVDVLDADSGEPIGTIGNLQGVHGIAIAPDLQRGFITNGNSNSVTVFDVTGTIKKIAVDQKPDAVTYDAMTQYIFVMNSGSESATVIDAVNLNVVRTIFLGGKPEFAVSDDLGHVYVNLEDRNQVVQINASGLNVVKRWSVMPGRVPASLAIDTRSQRLFIGCRNRKLVVMDAKSGKVITSLPIGDRVDATAFDEGTHKIISSTGDGNITVVQQDDPNHYRIVQTIRTQKGSKTFGLDRKTHKLFVPAADFAAPVNARSKPAQKQHPELIKGSFKILIFEQ